MRILLVEDDPALRSTLNQALHAAGFGVDESSDGFAADAALKSGKYDLVVLDLGLPNLDGLEVLKNLRSRNDRTPVIILTARNDVTDKIKGLDVGADDYLIKPFSLPELEARVRALIRRATGGDLVLSNGPLLLDCTNRQATFKGERLELLPRELTILEALMKRFGQIVIKSRLVSQLSTWESEITENAIEVHIHRLRKKLEPLGVKIRTIHGVGYLLENYRDG